MNIKALLTAGTVLATTAVMASAPAVAAPGFGKFMKRVDRQASRIEQGVRSGELTRREFRKLKRQNNRIRRKIRAAKFDDGFIDRYERAHIRDALGNASDRIYRLKHNGRTQYGKGYKKSGKYGYKSVGKDIRKDRKGGVWIKIGSWF